MASKRHFCRIQMKPDRAMQVRNQLAVSVAGHFASPYKYTEYDGSDNFQTLEMRSSTWRYYVMDAPCVALVDCRTGEVVEELK